MLGEETVLLKALEGKRGQPEQRPPHPAERGLFGMPTVVHNVQTVAAVPWIIRHGDDAYAAIGAPDSPGTMLVQVRTPARDGIAEVPLGTPLRDVVALGGKLPAGRSIKAVLVGGPSGGLLPPELLDTPYDFESLREAGAHIGSGSVVVADDRACIVDLARLLTRFCAGEACGKTIPCRIGTRRLVEIADRDRGRPAPPDRPAAARGPVGRHRRVRPVRPRAPDDPPAQQRDAILPVRAGRAHRSKRLPSRRLPSDRGGRRCDLVKARWLT